MKEHTLSAQSNYLPWLTNCSTCGLQLFLLQLTSGKLQPSDLTKSCLLPFLLVVILVTLPMMMSANNDDNDDDDDDGRDAVGVSHAAPPRLRPPDNGSLGGATYTPPCTEYMYIAQLYIAQYIHCILVYICSAQAAWEGPGGDFRHAHDRIILSNTIIIVKFLFIILSNTIIIVIFFILSNPMITNVF